MLGRIGVWEVGVRGVSGGVREEGLGSRDEVWGRRGEGNRGEEGSMRD